MHTMTKVFKLISPEENSNSNWITSPAWDNVEISARNLLDRFDDNTKIWRYFDFTKFVSLLIDHTLFFTRLDNFYDKFEGRYFSDQMEQMFSIFNINNNLPNELKFKIHQISRLGNFANCWHINEYENYGMWKSYIKTDEGVAVQSTVGSLRRALMSSKGGGFIIDRVTYVDYDVEQSMVAVFEKHKALGEKIALLPAFFKTKYYEFENELRVVIFFELAIEDTKNISLDWLSELSSTAQPFIKAAVDLKELIHNIYVHPDSPGWFSHLIQSLLDKYELTFNAVKSNLVRPKSS